MNVATVSVTGEEYDFATQSYRLRMPMRGALSDLTHMKFMTILEYHPFTGSMLSVLSAGGSADDATAADLTCCPSAREQITVPQPPLSDCLPVPSI
jgi:hypothetical protein